MRTPPELTEDQEESLRRQLLSLIATTAATTGRSTLEVASTVIRITEHRYFPRRRLSAADRNPA